LRCSPHRSFQGADNHQRDSALARVDLADRPLDWRRGEALGAQHAPCSATASASVSPDSSGSQLISVVMRSEWQPVEA